MAPGVLPGLHPATCSSGIGRRLGDGIEAREELVTRSSGAVRPARLCAHAFLPMRVAEAGGSADLPARIDMVTALHACDTATDDAIDPGCEADPLHGAGAVLPGGVRPASNAGQGLRRTPLAELWRHPCTPVNWQPAQQCAALPVPGGLGLPGHGHGTGRLGAQPEERADPGPADRPARLRRRPCGGRAGGVRPDVAAAEPFRAAAETGRRCCDAGTASDDVPDLVQPVPGPATPEIWKKGSEHVYDGASDPHHRWPACPPFHSRVPAPCHPAGNNRQPVFLSEPDRQFWTCCETAPPGRALSSMPMC